jgi:hypothetical protein
MRRYHIDKGIRDESAIDPRTDLGYPVSNPTDQQYRDAGWLPVIEAETIPSGMVSPDGVTGAVEGDAYVERHVRLITQAVYESEQAAAIADEQSRQARADVFALTKPLMAVAGLAQVVPAIAPGDTIEAIGEKALAAHNAALVAGDQAMASQINAMSTAALMAYSGPLTHAECTGARMWRAFAVLMAGG